MNIWFFSFFTTSSKCYHRGSNWGSSTRGTALTRYVFIGCYDSGNNPDSNACRFKVCLNPSKTEPGLVMWWSMHNTYFVSHQTEVLKLLFISQNFLSFCSILVIISLYTLNSGWNRTCFAFACFLASTQLLFWVILYVVKTHTLMNLVLLTLSMTIYLLVSRITWSDCILDSLSCFSIHNILP